VGRTLLVTTALVAAELTAGAPAAAVASEVAPEAAAHFVVLARKGAPLARTEASVRDAGGRVVQSWPQIGVVVATSPDAGFAAAVRPLPGVVAAGATRNLAELVPAPAPVSATVSSTNESTVESRSAGGAEPLAAYQWSMRQIRADRAHAVSGGSRKVVVGVVDGGLDATHPDLAPNVDARRSVGCGAEGVPDTSPEAWAPLHPLFGHGTAVAGIIAAARNGIGIAGVAPNVRIASVRIADTDGFVYPEYLICGYVWAAEHGIQVTSASLFADPWFRWCDDDPDQAAAREAMRRAIGYAARRGAVNVAAIGNSNWDLSHPVLDNGSPDNGEPIERLTGNNCGIVPAETQGVVTVSAVGAQARKARYANYGIHDVDVTAPANDVGQLPDTPDGNPGILTTVNDGAWTYFGGTSAAAPHVAGVVALIRSTHPGWSPRQVTAALSRQADRLPCPPGGYDPDGTGTWLAHCEGGRSGQGFYGSGQVDALAAVTR
jgi:subtilisin family serine protease